MDDSFRVRADKVFGSLSASLSSSLQPPPDSSSAWSVAGDEVERRQWRRRSSIDDAAPDRDNTPCASSFHGGEFGIGSSIGMDPTLDFEDEEDEYDKVASGAEGADDRLYMDDVAHHGSYLNSHNVLLGGKDLRANHLAARHRLREDEAEAQKLNSTKPVVAFTKPVEKEEEGDQQPKPILKRKDGSSSSGMKSRKRVRFDPAFVEQGDKGESPGVGAREEVQNLVSDNGNAFRVSERGGNGYPVPDYLVNPSKYRCYSFDSATEVDEDGNTCMEEGFNVDQDESSNSDMEDASVQLPKSVPFVPKKKAGDCSMVRKQDKEEQSLNQTGFTVGMATMEESEISAVEKDDKSHPHECLPKRGGRSFRTKSMSDNESDS